jgi:hypothetical protein
MIIRLLGVQLLPVRWLAVVAQERFAIGNSLDGRGLHDAYMHALPEAAICLAWLVVGP